MNDDTTAIGVIIYILGMLTFCGSVGYLFLQFWSTIPVVNCGC